MILPLNEPRINLVQPVGIEPTSTVLQTAAMTTSAKVALFGAPVRNRTDFPCLQDRTSSVKGFKGNILEHRVRFELTVFRICNPVRWASPPPMHKLVPSTRIELVMTGYQPIVIPFNYKGINFFGVPYRYRSGTTAFTEQGAGHYTKDTPKKSNKIGTPTWNRTKINEFKARCDSHYTMREQNKQDVFLLVELKVQCINLLLTS